MFYRMDSRSPLSSQQITTRAQLRSKRLIQLALLLGLFVWYVMYVIAKRSPFILSSDGRISSGSHLNRAAKMKDCRCVKPIRGSA
jgi:hypothetical protein